MPLQEALLVDAEMGHHRRLSTREGRRTDRSTMPRFSSHDRPGRGPTPVGVAYSSHATAMRSNTSVKREPASAHGPTTVVTHAWLSTPAESRRTTASETYRYPRVPSGARHDHGWATTARDSDRRTWCRASHQPRRRLSGDLSAASPARLLKGSAIPESSYTTRGRHSAHLPAKVLGQKLRTHSIFLKSRSH
jgi:hypothetical protein